MAQPVIGLDIVYKSFINSLFEANMGWKTNVIFVFNAFFHLFGIKMIIIKYLKNPTSYRISKIVKFHYRSLYLTFTLNTLRVGFTMPE